MPLAIGLVILLAYLFATGAAATAIAQAKAHTGWLPSWLKSAFFFVVPVADVFLALGKWLSHHYGHYIGAIERQSQRWFGQLVHYQAVVGYWSLYWPIGLYHFAQHLYGHALPRAINARTKPLAKRIDAAEAQAKASAGVAHSTVKIVKGHSTVKETTVIKRVAMPHAAEWDWIHDHFNTLKKAVTAAAVGAVGVALPHVNSFPVPWGQTVKQIRRRLRRMELLLGATGAAALVARAIGGISPRCVKSGPIGKIARRLCGLDARAFEGLLSLLADTFFLANICDVIKVMVSGLGFIQPELTAFITATETMACYGENQSPPPLGVVVLDLPTAQAITGLPV